MHKPAAVDDAGRGVATSGQTQHHLHPHFLHDKGHHQHHHQHHQRTTAPLSGPHGARIAAFMSGRVASAYTPLESLLLFQALRAESVNPVNFVRISEQLQKIPLIRNDATFDAARLSPDALRDWYLSLLKEEAKRDLERSAGGARVVGTPFDGAGGCARRPDHTHNE